MTLERGPRRHGRQHGKRSDPAYRSSTAAPTPDQREPHHASTRLELRVRLDRTRDGRPATRSAARPDDHAPHERALAVHAGEVADVVDAFAAALVLLQ